MTYPRIEDQPPVGAEAFQVIDGRHAQSQAAVVLMVAGQLRGDDEVRALRRRLAGVTKEPAVESPPDQDGFPVPRLSPTPGRMSLAQIQDGIRGRHRVSLSGRPPRFDVWSKAFADGATRLYEQPSAGAAVELMALGLRHPLELVKVASAAAMLGVATPSARARTVLEKGSQSTEPIVRNVAATALARFSPNSALLRPLTRMGAAGAGPGPASTSTIVHGTWAASQAWWQPGGDFHTYLRALRPDLYSGADRFGWTGGYSDAARDDGAEKLCAWVHAHGGEPLDAFTHSHGGSVAMLATRAGLDLRQLVLLSCPVHVHKYFPDFAHAPSVTSIRVKLDLVILADRGGQKFHDARITEHVLPVWFDHSATHDPVVWEKHGVPAMIPR